MTETFDELQKRAEEELWNGFRTAAVKRHAGNRGAARENHLALFLEPRLPSRFGVATAEAVDTKDQWSTQLDVVIYDRHVTAPLLSDETAHILPAESLLAVIEVKTKLTMAELETCARAAKRLYELEPGGRPLITSRRDGAHANDRRYRCMYSIVAFESNLGADRWAEKEWRRLCGAVQKEGAALETIDRVLVLDRGLLLPPDARARTIDGEGKGMLREWFLHLTNFVVREASRRPDFDFQSYGRTVRRPGWSSLTEYPEGYDFTADDE